jgi:hypothetical protein
MLTWLTYVDPEEALSALGIIPSFLDEDDQRLSAEQINDRYVGGWSPVSGFTIDKEFRLCYPGDPPLNPVATTRLRSELITIYPYGWVVIGKIEDGTFEVSRCD